MSWEEVMDKGESLSQTRVPIAVQSVSGGYRGRKVRRDKVGERKKEIEGIGICG